MEGKLSRAERGLENLWYFRGMGIVISALRHFFVLYCHFRRRCQLLTLQGTFIVFECQSDLTDTYVTIDGITRLRASNKIVEYQPKYTNDIAIPPVINGYKMDVAYKVVAFADGRSCYDRDPKCRPKLKNASKVLIPGNTFTIRYEYSHDARYGFHEAFVVISYRHRCGNFVLYLKTEDEINAFFGNIIARIDKSKGRALIHQYNKMIKDTMKLYEL